MSFIPHWHSPIIIKFHCPTHNVKYKQMYRYSRATHLRVLLLYGLVDSVSRVRFQIRIRIWGGRGKRSAVIVIQRRSCPVQCVPSLLLLLCQPACWWNFYLGLICQRFHLVLFIFFAFFSLQVENFHSHEETFDASEWCDGQVLRTERGRCGKGGLLRHWVELTCLTLEPWMVADRTQDACWWGWPKSTGQVSQPPIPFPPVCTQFLLSSETKYEMTHLNDNCDGGRETPFVVEKKTLAYVISCSFDWGLENCPK